MRRMSVSSCRTRLRSRRPLVCAPRSLQRSACLNAPVLVGGSRRWLSSQPLLKDEQNLMSFSASKGRLTVRKEKGAAIPAEMPSREKDEKSQKRDRKNAARSIPYWLDNDVQFFRRTMTQLNPSLSKADVKKKLNMDFLKRGVVANGSGGSGVLYDYRQLYKDSIVSFSHAVQDNPEKLKPNLENVLDRLVDVGFADLQWSKKFRSFRRNKTDYQEYEKKLNDKTKQYNKRIRRLESSRQLLSELESNPPPEIQDEVPPTDEPKSTVDRIIQSVSSLWEGGDASKQPTDKKDSGNSMIVNAYVERLEKQKRTVHHVQLAVDKVANQIKRLEADCARFSPVLPTIEYDHASSVVQDVLKDISLAFAAHIQDRHSRMIEQYRVLDAKTDLTKPHEWYQHARMDRRKIIFHGGPTNSGKTHAALERLKKAQKGIYLGPLRLLAAEVYENLTAQGLYTSLYTGQEKREVPFATHVAATVEIAPTMEDFDCVVIDEIQMIADPFRGFAWSRALLGMRCKEIHVCGSLEAEEIVRRMVKVCGDEFELRRYKRFGDLKVAKKSVASSPNMRGSFKSVRKGDCVVAFSRNDIFAIKREIERTTEHKCCVVYGMLPPETRTDQARLFNDPDSGYDVLVASDAIGMGLNLNIGRIIFNSVYKSNGDAIVQLDHSSVKQISGRAGRKNSPFPCGFVTCRDPRDMAHLRKCIKENVPSIQKAGLLPTSDHIENFSEALEKYELGKEYDNLFKILVEFEDLAKTKGDFFICKQTPMQVISQLVDDLPISIRDKYTICMAPAAVNNQYSLRTLKKFAEKYATAEAPGLSGKLIPKRAKSFDDLSTLCSIHNELELFLWLSARFPGNAVEQQTAQALKEETISFINKGLRESEKLKLDHCYIDRDAKLREEWKKSLARNGEASDSS